MTHDYADGVSLSVPEASQLLPQVMRDIERHQLTAIDRPQHGWRHPDTAEGRQRVGLAETGERRYSSTNEPLAHRLGAVEPWQLRRPADDDERLMLLLYPRRG